VIQVRRPDAPGGVRQDDENEKLQDELDQWIIRSRRLQRVRVKVSLSYDQ
jgi:hypothetical protein